jgi:predicted unusual protein kinase regulating ubiquinone biosynthesis (AarF/ABC1/UbiB family)
LGPCPAVGWGWGGCGAVRAASVGSGGMSARGPRRVALASVGAALAGLVAVRALRAARSRRDGDPGGGAPSGNGAAEAGAAAAGTAERSAIGPRTRLDRTARMARIGGQAGASYALHRARRAFASVERQAELDERFELKTAEQITAALGNMKGALMKLGQMASYLDAGLPPHVRAALADLQQNAPPMSADLAAEVVERELGEAPDRVFLEWAPQPIASASIGQVHKAITRDGRAVAVKVQYPGVDQAIKADLDNSGLVFGAMGLGFPGLDPGPLVEEIRERLVEELDYRIEARNQQLFVDYYRDHPFIHVPEVLTHLSTGRVLTTELAEGARFAELVEWPQDERNLAAETIDRFVFRSLYRLQAFNGDPHPGNYLFRPGGHVTFLDFGLVKHFTPDEIEVFGDMIRAMVFERDTARFRRIIERVGLLRPGEPFSDQMVLDYFGHFYEYVMEDAEVTITPEWSSQTVSRFFDNSGPYGDVMKAANVPPSFVIIQRINLGLFAILGELRATANFRRVSEELWPWVDGPASTPLGEAEAEWVARRTADARSRGGTGS